MDDEKKEYEGTKVMDSFCSYVGKSGQLMLGFDQNGLDHLEAFFGTESGREAITSFVNGEDATFVLEMHSSLRSKSVGVDEQDTASEEVEFSAFKEIPNTALDPTRLKKNYLLFTNLSEGDALKEEDEVPMSDQVLISKFDPMHPFSSMIPRIRHTFVPIATLRESKEQKQKEKKRGLIKHKSAGDGAEASAIKEILDKLRELEVKLMETQDDAKLPDVSLEPIAEIAAWLDTLNDAQKKEIVECHRKQKYDLDVPEHLKNNSSVVKKLLRRTRDWKDNITSVSRRSKPSQGRNATVQQEIKFWRAKQAALDQVEDQLMTVEVCASLLVLIANKHRVQARAFADGVQVNDAKREVQLHLDLLATFPIKDKVLVTKVSEIYEEINDIFKHLDQFKKNNNYPVQRLASLARSSAKDISNQLISVLSRDIMIIKYTTFNAYYNESDRLFRSFSNKYTKLRSDLRQRELTQGGARRMHGVRDQWHREQETELNQLEKRVESIRKIRKGHAEIVKVIDSTFNNSKDAEVLADERKKISDAYTVFRKLDVLRAPANEWEKCVQEYEYKIQEVEKEIKMMIREAMEHASTPREMFRVCEKYNKLFVRDIIRDAVWEFQEELVKNVDQEVIQLQKRYVIKLFM